MHRIGRGAEERERLFDDIADIGVGADYLPAGRMEIEAAPQYAPELVRIARVKGAPHVGGPDDRPDETRIERAELSLSATTLLSL